MDCLRRGPHFVRGWIARHGALPARDRARGDSTHVFELRFYHAVPAKGPALESVFRDASNLMANHGINVVGYWVPNEDPAWKDTFIYIVAHPSREKAKKNWDVLHSDAAFRPYIEAAKPLIDKAGKVFRVDEVYMRSTDFSPMQ